MAKAGGCLFRIGYFLYTKTRIGYYYHRRDVAKAREKYKTEGHTVTQPATYGALQVIPVAMSLDNYGYIILDTDSKTCVVIDPGEPEPVQVVLNEKELIPEAVLVTHKHWDHSGGNAEMKNRYHGIRVHGGIQDNVPDVTHPVSDGDVLTFGRLMFQVLFTPGHTVGHTVFVLEGAPFGAPDCLFSGDHLFLGGCGRMFERPPLTMLQSLDAVLKLRPETLVWPGHEYAKDNLEFACDLEPDNTDAKKKLDWVKQQRQSKYRTCPSTLGEEVHYNPFLRTGEETVLKALGMISGPGFERPDDAVRAKALKEVRERKDTFSYIM